MGFFNVIQADHMKLFFDKDQLLYGMISICLSFL